MAWNFREWINTTVYGSCMWQKVVAKTGVKVKEEKGEPQVVENDLDAAVAKLMDSSGDLEFPS